MTNPFSLSFGKEPLSFIERGRQSRLITKGIIVFISGSTPV